MNAFSCFTKIGYEKVAGILDGDKSDEKAILEKEFPEYFFVCIPAKDIRTKPARKAVEEVVGLLDSEKNIKPEYTDSMAKLFDSLTHHMNS